MRQIKLKIDTTFSESRSAGIAIKYLNSGEIPLRDGVELALSCLLTPIAMAASGENIEKVRARQEVSRTIFETYMSLALSRAEIDKSEAAELAAQENNFPSATAISPTIENHQKSLVELEETFENSSNLAVADKEEVLTEINFDDEEF